ncbi:MAG: YigZ family protein [Bacteroidota bacterium]
MQDTYKTILKPSNEVLFKDKNSKFYSYAFPFTSENLLPHIISELKSNHQKAGHFCYAYQIGKTETSQVYRVNDDGEPNNSAGMPIYGQIQSADVTDILIVVIRYFGGTKLGVSGLINAYKTSAKLALQSAEIVEKTITVDYLISFDYKNMNKVMRIIKERNLEIIEQKLELDCNIKISVRKKESNSIFQLFDRLFEITIKKEDA